MTKKRKSVDAGASATKKVKVAKSAEKPAPPKSALKKSKGETAKVKTEKTKPVVAADEVEMKKESAKSTKKTDKKPKPALDDSAAADQTLTADQTASLLAGFSSEDESEGEEEEKAIPVSKLPKVPTQFDIQTRINKATKGANTDPERTPGIIYIGRIPRGFHEPQMKAYFSQFGEIAHLKLARNRKTGASKHFAFVEFSSSAVAEIVAKTMDKYLLFGHILQVRVVDPSTVRDKEGMWKGEGRRGRNVRPNRKIEGGVLKRGKTREEWEGKVARETRKRAAKGEKLAEMGYEFEMPGVKAVDAVPVKDKAVEEGAATVGAEEAAAEQAAAPKETVQVEQSVGQADDGSGVATETKMTNKRAADGKPKVKEAKKVVKKVKA